MISSELHKLFIASDGISTDTRTIKPNQLFFAIKGDNFDGNKYAKQALISGACFAVVEDKNLSDLKNIIVVNDALKTLQDLANFHRRQFNIPVIGITGSNGKTTSKELINAVLCQNYKTLVTEGNLNNHLGVPFTLLRMNNSHQIAIIEMGANKPGDIKELAEIAEPTHGVITNIGKAHLEGFGDLQGVVDTKAELFRNVSSTNGVLFVNMHDDILTSQIPKGIELVGYGSGSGAVEGEVVKANPLIAFKWQNKGYQSSTIQSQLVGGYNLNNFLLAICIGAYFDVKNELMDEAIANYKPANNRSQITKTTRNTLIVDCYNANPSSMHSAVNSFNSITADSKIMILGDMLELGKIKEDEHKAIISLVNEVGIDTILVGAIFQSLHPNCKHYATVDDLIASENTTEIVGQTILLKGSRGVKLEKLIELL